MICPKCGEIVHLDDKQCKHYKEKLKFGYFPDMIDEPEAGSFLSNELKLIILISAITLFLSATSFILIKFIL